MRIQLPILSFICIPLVILPLFWHIRTRNIPILAIAFCLFFTNLIHGINSIVWSGSVVTKIPVWCDITTKFSLGVQVALPAASMCITKHLEHVASLRQTIQTAADTRRRRIFEFCMVCVFPCIIMALHYVVQGHRFDIAEDFGCLPTVYYSWPAFLIIYVPPILLAFASLVFAAIAFFWFMRRRAQFAEHLQSSNSGLTTSRYFRLMALAVTEIVVGSGIGSYVLASNIQNSFFRTWDNWAHVHVNFSRVIQFPTVLVPDFFWNELLLTYYIPPFASFIFFLFFGFNQEAIGEYRRFYSWFRTTILRLPPKPSNDSVLPTFSAPRVVRSVKHDDLEMISLDGKWDADKQDADSVSLGSSLPPTERPVSTPPSEDRPSAEGQTVRPVSLDLPRHGDVA